MLSLEAAPSGCPRTASARYFVGRGARGFWSPLNGGLDLDAAALEGAGESVGARYREDDRPAAHRAGIVDRQGDEGGPSGIAVVPGSMRRSVLISRFGGRRRGCRSFRRSLAALHQRTALAVTPEAPLRAQKCHLPKSSAIPLPRPFFSGFFAQKFLCQNDSTWIGISLIRQVLLTLSRIVSRLGFYFLREFSLRAGRF